MRVCVCVRVGRGNVRATMFYFQRANKITELGMPFFFHTWGKNLVYFLLIKKNRRGPMVNRRGGGGLGVGSASS